MGFELSKDYIDVAERLREWYEKYPLGRVTTAIVELTEKKVVVKAEAFRDATATIPAGVGHSAMVIPGSTPYTRGSELENCETSAVGRALVMAGLASKRIASADEIESKRAPEGAPTVFPVSEPSAGVSEGSPSRVPASPSISEDEALVFAARAMGFVEADEAKGSGVCPKHARPWKLREGTGAKGPYSFYSCGAKDDTERSGWCNLRPSIAWVNAQGGGR